MILLWTPLLPEGKGQTNDADASEKFVCPKSEATSGVKLQVFLGVMWQNVHIPVNFGLATAPSARFKGILNSLFFFFWAFFFYFCHVRKVPKMKESLFSGNFHFCQFFALHFHAGLPFWVDLVIFRKGGVQNNIFGAKSALGLSACSNQHQKPQKRHFPLEFIRQKGCAKKRRHLHPPLDEGMPEIGHYGFCHESTILP